MKKKILPFLKLIIVDIVIDIAVLLTIILYSIVRWEYDTEHILGLLVAFLGLLFWIIARKQLGKSFSVKPEAKELVTYGLYSKIRNPIYFFSFIAFTGAIMSADRPILFFVLGVVLLVQILRIGKENKILYEKFGEEYLIYKKETWF